MELVVRKNELLRELQLFQGIVERKNTIPILANVLIEAKGDRGTDARDRPRSGVAKPVPCLGCQRWVADAAGEEALRDRQGAAGNGCANRGRQERREGCRRSVRLADADAAARGFSDAARRQRKDPRHASAQRAEGDGREDTVRDHRRRHSIFSERREVRLAARHSHPGRHRWSPSGAGRGAAHGRHRRRDRRDSPQEDAAGARKTAGRRRRRRRVRGG